MMDTRIDIIRWKGEEARVCTDSVALEAPLEILVNGESLAVTMRTPGNDFALAAGFLFAESLIRSAEDIQTIDYCGAPGDPDERNLLHVGLKAEDIPMFERARLQRNFLATSSCGVCGKASIAAAQCLALPLPETELRVRASVLQSLSDRMRAAQSTFDRTGGLHAAGLFTKEGTLFALREDVGRHNAVDKVVGAEVLAGRMPLQDRILLVSGRAGFEILQKAAMARIPLVCSVSAPSSLAITLADDLKITLIGFLRGDTMNVYTHPERVCA